MHKLTKCFAISQRKAWAHVAAVVEDAQRVVRSGKELVLCLMERGWCVGLSIVTGRIDEACTACVVREMSMQPIAIGQENIRTLLGVIG